MKNLIFLLPLFASPINVSAQTAAGLFWRSDSLQTSELASSNTKRNRREETEPSG